MLHIYPVRFVFVPLESRITSSNYHWRHNVFSAKTSGYLRLSKLAVEGRRRSAKKSARIQESGPELAEKLAIIQGCRKDGGTAKNTMKDPWAQASKSPKKPGDGAKKLANFQPAKKTMKGLMGRSLKNRPTFRRQKKP
jgi:hypothetical protein